MCALFDEIEKQAEEKAKREITKNLYEMGLSIDQIVQAVSYPVEVIEKWLGLATVQNTEVAAPVMVKLSGCISADNPG